MIPAGYTLRAARDADRAAVRALVGSSLAEHGLALAPDGTDADLDDLVGSYAGRGGRFDVLVDPAGAVVGTVGLYPLDHSRVELRKMYLAPALRGRGLGQALLRHALDGARALGFRRVQLETARTMERAIALYRRNGFQSIAHEAPSRTRCEVAFALDLVAARAAP